jgi:type 1 fimbria pilin
MKNKLFIAAFAVLAASSMNAAQAEMVEATLSGTLTDSMCKMDHASMLKSGHGKNAADCAQKCLQDGAKLLFVESKTKTEFSLQNAGTAKKLAGKQVSISGHVDREKKLIHVHSVKQS